jgi:hypothetical protein
VGNASETVEVTGAAPLLQTEDANITTTFTPTQIDNLPSPGGDITNYAQTAPGVVMNSGSGGYGNFSAFGLPATSNLFTLNGNDENDPFLNLNNSGSSNLLLGQNEVQEVAVVSNGYTGQYGRQAGVQVDYSTKSGSNAFHGNAGFWYNSSGFNANDWFQKQGELFSDSPQQQPFAVNHQWAGSIGGPIVKDKLFFYVDQEGLYYALPSTQSLYVPLPGFSSAILGNIATTQPAELPYYTSMMNLYKGSPYYAKAIANPATFDPTGFGGCGSGFTALAGFGTNATPCTGLAVASGVNHNKEWLLTERIDYNISNSDKLFGRFKADHGSQPTSTDLVSPAIFSTKSIQPEYEGQINETHVFSPTMVNNFIISGLWYSAIFLPDSGQSAVLGALGYSTVAVDGGADLSELGGTSVPDYFFPQGRNSSMGQLTDDLSITRGAHTFKMGVNFRRDIFKDVDGQGNTGGYVQFGTMNDFANGLVSGATGGSLQQNFTTNTDVRIGFYSLGLYFQDEYRVSSNLKLTLALRGDRNSNAICSSDCFSRLNTAFSGLTHDAATPYNQVISTDLHSAFPAIEKLALQPRMGFTWSPMGLKDTVIRGGIGVFSDLYQGVLLDSLFENSPLFNGFTVNPAAGAPVAPGVTGSVGALAAASNASLLTGFASGGTLASIGASNPFFSPPGYFSVANQINNPKYLEWSAEIQQAVGSKMALNLKYVGTHGYNNLIQNGGINATNASGLLTGAFTPFGQLPAAGVNAAGTVILSGTDPRFSTVRELSSDGISNYDGLVATITRRMSYGFQGSLNYTYSHALDDATTTNPGTPFNSFQSVVYQVNPNCLSCLNYSNADSDARHNITANYVWNEPFKSQNRMLNYLVGGWGLGGTFFYHTGLPYSVQSYQTGVFYDQGLPLGDFLGGSTGCSVKSSYPYAGVCVTGAQFSPYNFSGGISQANFGNTARNAFRGPGYFDTDMTVNKDFAMTEHATFQLGAAFFNILNHPNFALPDGYNFQGAFGNLYTMAIQPTSPYGSFQGAGVEGRLIQVHAKITF